MDPKQLAAQLEGIKEAESPCVSQSSSQQDYQNLSASSACSSPRSEPRSEPTSTSSDQYHTVPSEARFLVKPEQRLGPKKTSASAVIYENIKVKEQWITSYNSYIKTFFLDFQFLETCLSDNNARCVGQ